MTRERLENLFYAAFHLTELQCMLQQTLTLPLQGCPSGLYLQIRARLRDCLESFPFDLDASKLTQSVHEALKVVEPRPCFDADLRGQGELRDSREAYETIIKVLKENEGTESGGLRQIRARSYFDMEANNRDYEKLIRRSVAAATKLDYEMGDFRKQKKIDFGSFCCFTAGWALAVFACYATALARFSGFISHDGFPTETTLFTYRRYLRGVLPIVEDFLDKLILPQWIESLACLSALRCLMTVAKSDLDLSDGTADLMRRIADEALAQRGLKPIFAPILEELEAVYSEDESAQWNEKALEQAWQFRNQALDAQERYFVSHDIADLNAAIALAEKALNFAPVHPRGGALHQELLSLLLFVRFEHAGAVADVDASITRALSALEGLQSNHLIVPTTLANLGRMLTFRFERAQSKRDIEMAIDALEQTVDRGAGPIGRQTYWWANLANALRLRFNEAGGEIGDLDEAIRLYEAVLKATPSSWSERSTLEVNLSNTVFDRQKATGELRDASLDQKIELLRTTIRNLRDQPREQARAYRNLGLTLRLKGAFDSGARLQASEAMRAAVKTGMDVSVPETLDTAVDWGNWAFESGAWDEAVEAYGYACALAEQQFRVQLTPAEQASILRSTQGLAGNAAFALVHAGRLQNAVVTLEAGLGRMLADAMEKKRKDLERLHDSGQSDLLERYEALAGQIAALGGPSARGRVHANSPFSPARTLDELRREFDETIADIRAVPGFADFLSNLTIDQIRAVSHGCLVYVVATDRGGLALIVENGRRASIRAVELPALKAGWVRDRVRRHWSGRDDADSWRAALDALLIDLGAVVMEPLLDAIGAVARATIVPVGLLQLLPLHAAIVRDQAERKEGIGAGVAGRLRAATRRDGATAYACDQLVMTYAPNAHALLSRPVVPSGEDDRILVVQNSDGGKLQWTTLEVDLIRRSAGNVVHVADEAATLAAVLDQIAAPSVLHFSCHGSANLAQPLQSGLVLAEDDVLTVSYLTNAGPLSARLAVLAACESGAAGSQLPDEVISLPTALLQSGIPSVIATLWPIGDLPAALIVGRFYHNWQKKRMAAIDAFVEAQHWLRTSSWAELELFVRALGCAADDMRANESSDEKPYAHPAFWAPFYWTGSHG